MQHHALLEGRPRHVSRIQRELRSSRVKSTEEILCARFFVSPTKLLTAAHAFKNTDKKGFSNHFILRGGKFERVTILKIDYKLDICLLLAKPNSSRLVLSEKIDPVVTIRGFPAADKSQSDIEGKSGLFEEKVEINKPARWGMSGGPVLNKDGTVCGMLVWKDFLNTYSKAISSKTLLRFLK